MRRVREGKIPFHWSVAEPSESECPVSAITPKSIELVQLVASLQIAHEATGSTLSAAEMPGAIADAIRIIENESRAIDNARDDALYQQ